MTLNHCVDGTVEPSLAHSGRELLLIESLGDDPGVQSFAPELKDLLDDPVLLRVYYEFSFEPVIAEGQDRRAHLGGPLRFLFRSYGGSSKCVATRRECLADRCFCEARLLLYLT